MFQDVLAPELQPEGCDPFCVSRLDSPHGEVGNLVGVVDGHWKPRWSNGPIVEKGQRKYGLDRQVERKRPVRTDVDGFGGGIPTRWEGGDDKCFPLAQSKHHTFLRHRCVGSFESVDPRCPALDDLDQMES